MSIERMRREYGRMVLSEQTIDRDPIRQFAAWFNEAQAYREVEWFEANVMTLATVTPDGRPAARTVLLKGFDERGFTFFTNYDGHKAQELAGNPHAALVLHWPPFERQVRITGRVSFTTRSESEAYFRTRPRGSQLGAWVSRQSRIMPSRAVLEEELAKLERQYAGREVPTPPNWGGYRLLPDTIEFWQGGSNRLHDRLRYRRSSSDEPWRIERLAP